MLFLVHLSTAWHCSLPAAAKRKDKQGPSSFAIYNKYKGCVKWALIQSSALQAGIVSRLSFGDATFAVIKTSAMFTIACQ